MADDNRYGGGYGSSSYGNGNYGRDRESNDDFRGYNPSSDPNRGYGAYSQGGGYGQGAGQSSGGYGQQDERGYQARGGERDNERFNNSDENRRVAIDETDRLIASNKVEGTAVYDRRGRRLGSIENFMVDKRSGRVDYAVLSFGGFLGLGARYYPLPWNQLTYDERHRGYVVDLTERDLDRAPSHRAGDDALFDRRYSSAVDSYYGTLRY